MYIHKFYFYSILDIIKVINCLPSSNHNEQVRERFKEIYCDSNQKYFFFLANLLLKLFLERLNIFTQLKLYLYAKK